MEAFHTSPRDGEPGGSGDPGGAHRARLHHPKGRNRGQGHSRQRGVKSGNLQSAPFHRGLMLPEELTTRPIQNLGTPKKKYPLPGGLRPFILQFSAHIKKICIKNFRNLNKSLTLPVWLHIIHLEIVRSGPWSLVALGSSVLIWSICSSPRGTRSSWSTTSLEESSPTSTMSRPAES